MNNNILVTDIMIFAIIIFAASPLWSLFRGDIMRFRGGVGGIPPTRHSNIGSQRTGNSLSLQRRVLRFIRKGWHDGQLRDKREDGRESEIGFRIKGESVCTSSHSRHHRYGVSSGNSLPCVTMVTSKLLHVTT